MSRLLEVRHLRTAFPGPSPGLRARGAESRIHVVDDVSFELDRGEVLALVGESGSGKSMTALSLLRLVPKPGRVVEGEVRLGGEDLLGLSVSEMRRVRGKRVAMIFQEPMTALNPVVRVGEQVVEAIRLHETVSRVDARAQTRALFAEVGIPDPEARLDAYPHQLSGGLKQRVMIAMALSTRPELLIADEPTTALDVTIQAQILGLLRNLQRERGTAILLITHDLGIVNQLADRIAVMYAGRLVELAPREALLSTPLHPYTRGLLAAIPALATPGSRLHEIPGTVPSASRWPLGCRFAPRCSERFAPCESVDPAETTRPGDRRVYCHAVAEGRAPSPTREVGR
ncbi:ABC transporter ATP-binding protein [Myxococcota bacterium]|nr:ABC transporter ATP-binding protein [Myxococcota bacterium]